MYFIFNRSKVAHVINKSSREGAPFTLCGLLCNRGLQRGALAPPVRLCKRCAKWLPRKEEPVA
ncbi:unnamed protein product [marine sediment metagenome]|uniref:Uncharacterized protein n=1 Tax=marine sediment metagenome TaxID=412755 RepID=X1RCW4_9ZZZZ